jgi:hypothetical protein
MAIRFRFGTAVPEITPSPQETLAYLTLEKYNWFVLYENWALYTESLGKE